MGEEDLGVNQSKIVFVNNPTTELARRVAHEFHVLSYNTPHLFYAKIALVNVRRDSDSVMILPLEERVELVNASEFEERVSQSMHHYTLRLAIAIPKPKHASENAGLYCRLGMPFVMVVGQDEYESVCAVVDKFCAGETPLANGIFGSKNLAVLVPPQKGFLDEQVSRIHQAFLLLSSLAEQGVVGPYHVDEIGYGQ